MKTSDEYRWSSHPGYAKKADKKNIIDTDQVLRMFSEDKAKARRFYRAYMSDGLTVKKDDIYSTIDQRIIGGEEFVGKVIEKYDIEIRQKKRKKEYTLHEIARGIEEVSGITLGQIRQKSKSRDISSGKKLLSLVAEEYGYKGKEIAEYIQKDPTIVTRHLKEKKGLKKEIEKVIKTLRNERTNVNSQV